MNTRWLRLSGAALVAGLTTLALAGPAHADPAAAPVTGNATSDKTGWKIWDEARNAHGVFKIGIDINGKPQPAYCIDIKHDISAKEGDNTYVESGWGPSNVANLAKVQWILNNSHPNFDVLDANHANVDVKGAKDREQVAYSATQAAIWHLTDGFNLLGSTKEEAPPPAEAAGSVEAEKSSSGLRKPILKVYQWLLEHATATPEPGPALKIDPASKSGVSGDKLGPYTVTTTATDVSLKVTSGTGKIVDKDGKDLAKVANGGKFYIHSEQVGTVKVEADATAKVPTGRVFVFAKKPNEAQKIILAGQAETTVKAATQGEFKTGLPVTGAKVTAYAGGGVALLAVGAGLAYMMRRRRIRFTA